MKLLTGLSVNSPQNNELDFYGIKMTGIYAETGQRRILQLVYQGDAVVCLERVVGAGVLSDRLSWIVTFYAAYFYIQGIEHVLQDFIGQYSEDMVVGRCDLCMDVSLSVNDLWSNHTTTVLKKQIYKKADQIETFYLGSKTHNQKHFIRVYNKKLDSLKKGKFHLFLDYVVEECVSRIEVQINSLSCKKFGITPQNILQLHNSHIHEQAFSYLYKSVFLHLCFNRLSTCFMVDLVPKMKERLEYKKYPQHEILSQLAYARTMLGYAKRLHDLGFDVISYLKQELRSVKSSKEWEWPEL